MKRFKSSDGLTALTSEDSPVAPSVKDVAAMAGVSIGTVSNVLNRPTKVSTDTRERVERAIRELGFIPSAPARNLRTKHARVLGLIVPDIGNPFFTEVARGVEDAALEAGYGVMLCNTDQRADREDQYLRLLESQRVGGILITPARRSMKPLDRLIAGGTAIALLDNSSPSRQACSVYVDDAMGGTIAATHLQDLGHSSIMWLAGPSDIPQVAEREAGILRFANEHDMTVIRIEAEQMSAEAGDRAMGAALSNKLSATALICANDLLALGAVRALTRAGLRVPQDISIVGYDDIDFAANAAVPLTSIRQPKYELGFAAAQLILQECESSEPHAHRQIRFEPQLVIRSSTSAPHT